jgi:serine/threonine protein kinase/ABC-type branched-subunit amino acid transport system substrate-binding protein
MECPYCNTENRDGVRFCNNCGKPLPLDPTAASSAPKPAVAASNAKVTSRSLTPGSRVQGGRYVIKKILGQGGMGAALLATDIRLDSKPVVIKELISDNTDPAQLQEDVRNFKREVATLAHLDHPLIPNVTDHFQEGSRYFMVQEYVEGENLEERMDRVNQPMKEREALGYASQVLDILEYLSQETPPIVHRDIKPANIIIGTKDKRAHLVDFGIARADVTRNAQRKQTSALGTPGYAPPEQYQGNADPRSDLYALAATLHHLLTNRDPRNHPPFTYPPARALNPQLSPEIEKILSRALINDINQRYQSAAAMKKDIDDILLKRFGVSDNTSSYTLGTSGPIGAVNAASAPTVPQQPTRTQPAAPYQGSQRQQPLPPPPPQQQRGQGNWQNIPPYSPPVALSNRPPTRPPQQSNQGYLGRSLLLLILVVLLIGGLFFAIPYFQAHPFGQSNNTNSGTTPTISTSALPANGIGPVKAPDGETIGISDGTVAFAISGPGGIAKKQAADQLKAGDAVAAGSLWQSALSSDSGDAESLIYLEDQNVLNKHATSNTPYITIVVGTLMTGDNASVGHDDLQGAYVAQKEFNDSSQLAGGTQVRLLIANSGNNKLYATTVAQQIVLLAKSDSTFVGVMGWPFSTHALEAINTLAKARIPMVSETASSDDLTHISPYFFRVAPSNKTQAILGAKYAEQTLLAKTAVAFVDPADSYSRSLENSFAAQFIADGNKILATENYTVGQNGHAALPGLLQKALSTNPDIIYFAGHADDVSILLSNLPTSGQYSTLPILGGDALYELNYPTSARAGFNHLRFTAFAYPDEWDVQNLQSQKPRFFGDYSATYNPNNQHASGQYGYTRPTADTILSYDAMLTMLKASNIALSSSISFTPADLQKALQQITGAKAIQGVSGQISFASNNDPSNKAIVILYVDPKGFIHLKSVQGCFLLNQCK